MIFVGIVCARQEIPALSSTDCDSHLMDPFRVPAKKSMRKEKKPAVEGRSHRLHVLVR